MHVMTADGTGLRPLPSDVDLRGTASWSPDGKWIVVAGSDRSGLGLFKLPVDGGSPVRIATGPFLDPVWSPRGDLIVYCGPQVFTLTPLLAVRPGGTPATLPDIKVAAPRLSGLLAARPQHDALKAFDSAEQFRSDADL